VTLPLLVGELNPHGADPRHALFPYPAGSAGGRLCRKVLGLEPREYLKGFSRTNLCVGRWSDRAAHGAALAIREAAELDGRKVVLLGLKVCTAFGLLYDPFTVKSAAGRLPVAVLPHPSGRCRTWNDPGAYERARAVLRVYGAL
jgi:hypothetical protein